MTLLAAVLSLLVVTIGFTAAGAQTGVMLALLTKPVVDTSWADRAFGISPLAVVGVLVPVMIFIHSMRRGPPLSSIPLAGLWFAFTGYGMLTSLHLLASHGLVPALEMAAKNINPIIGFYMLAALFADRASFKRLLVVLLLAGLFPVLVGLYQEFVGGSAFRQRMTVGLVRNVGLYHDSVTTRWYVFQTLTAILLYWSYFLSARGGTIIKIILIAYAAATLFVLYKIYSKSGVLTAGLWFLIWMFGQRQARVLLLAAPLLFVVAFAEGDRVTSEIEQLYSKEVVGLSEDATEWDKKRMLAGRFYGWEAMLASFSNRDFIWQVFGNGTGMGAHNDYLFRLSSGGYIGLALYVWLIGAIGLRVLALYLRSRTPLNTMALMLFLMWLVDSIGLVPSAYPSFQWFVLGFIGLALKGVEFEARDRRPTKRASRLPVESPAPARQADEGQRP